MTAPATTARPAPAGRARPVPPRKAPMTVTQSLPHVEGIDLSITATAFAWPDGETQVTGESGLTSVAIPPDERAYRLKELAGRLDNKTRERRGLWDGWAPALIAIEDLPTSGTRVDAERCYLWLETVRLIGGYGTPVVVVPPTTVKLYAAGLGNANKREVIASVRRDLPQFQIKKTGKRGNILDSDDDNRADAAVLCAIACHLVGVPIVEVTAYRERALEKLILPEGVRRA